MIIHLYMCLLIRTNFDLQIDQPPAPRLLRLGLNFLTIITLSCQFLILSWFQLSSGLRNSNPRWTCYYRVYFQVQWRISQILMNVTLSTCIEVGCGTTCTWRTKELRTKVTPTCLLYKLRRQVLNPTALCTVLFRHPLLMLTRLVNSTYHTAFSNHETTSTQ